MYRNVRSATDVDSQRLPLKKKMLEFMTSAIENVLQATAAAKAAVAAMERERKTFIAAKIAEGWRKVSVNESDDARLVWLCHPDLSEDMLIDAIERDAEEEVFPEKAVFLYYA